ncbi:hypothetical protein BDK51DRAFT_30537, partial [Blyttiomyces helicus]
MPLIIQNECDPQAHITLSAKDLAALYPPKLDRLKATVNSIACPQGPASHTDVPIHITRLRPRPLPVNLVNKAWHPPEKTHLLVRPDAYSYDSRDSANLKTLLGDAAKHHNVREWYVNFADKRIFRNYGSDECFASDEVQVAEHPILASVREALLHLAGDHHEATTFWDQVKELAGFKREDTFALATQFNHVERAGAAKDVAAFRRTHPELLSPQTTDNAGRPSPFLFENVERKCEIKGGGGLSGREFLFFSR